MAGYLWATGLLGLHGTEAYAPLRHQDQKHFLRLHIQADEALTVYPIGVDRVGRKWTLRPTRLRTPPGLPQMGLSPSRISSNGRS